MKLGKYFPIQLIPICNPVFKSNIVNILPSVYTDPSVGLNIFAIILNNDDFPLPFDPKIPTFSPSLISKLMSCSADTNEKFFYFDF